MKKFLKIMVATWLLFSFGSSGQTGSSVVTINTLSTPQSIQFSPNGETLYLGTVYSDSMAKDETKKENTIESHDLKTGNLIKKYKFDCDIHCYNAPIVISKDGKEMYTPIQTGKDFIIQKLNIETGNIYGIKNENTEVFHVGNGLALSKNLKYLIIGGYYIYII